MAGVSTRRGIDSYLLCGTPRTGSTLLCGLLRSTGVAGVPESYFRLPDESGWSRRWGVPRAPDGTLDYSSFVRAAVAAGRTDNGVFGARVMWGTMDQLVARLGAVYPDHAGADLDLLTRAFGPTRFVHLQREDTLAQAVSWVRAEQTGFWQDGDAAPGAREPRFDAQQIRDCIRVIDDHNAAWRGWFAAFDIRPHPVGYEELVADMAGVTEDILRFLDIGIPDGWALTGGQHRQADEINDEWIIRYRALVTPDLVVAPRGADTL